MKKTSNNSASQNFEVMTHSVNSRLSALRTAKERKDATAPALVPMMPSVQSELDSKQPQLVAKNDAVNVAKGQQTAKSAEVAPLLRMARLWVGHGYQALINATVREEFPKTVLSYYGLSNTSQGAPPMTTEQAVLDAHTAYNAGEVARIAAGGVAIPFPSGTDIDTHANSFRTANLQQAALKDAYDNAQENLNAYLPEIDVLILKMWNGIEANFGTGDKPSMRRKAREWGVVYVPSPGEVPSPDEYSIMGKTGELLADGTTVPLEDVEATVIETNDTVMSDVEGNYFVGLLPAGNYNVRFKKFGYMEQTLPITIVEGVVAMLNVTMLRDAPPPPMP
jgi:hypothetical protein